MCGNDKKYGKGMEFRYLRQISLCNISRGGAGGRGREPGKIGRQEEGGKRERNAKR